MILDRNTDLLVKMEEREDELHAINVDLKAKVLSRYCWMS